jgi:hypothetical protein
MTIRSRSSRTFASPAAVLAAAVLAAGALAQDSATFPLAKSCDAGADTVATLRASDQVKVRYSSATGNGTCYAVTATIDGKSVSGYLHGAAHPGIAAFEQEVRSNAVVIPPAPPPPPAPAPAPAAASIAARPAAPEPAAPPLSFAGFHAISIDGWPVDLSHERAANVFIYFWSARNRAGIRATETAGTIYDKYHARGVYVVGVGSAASPEQLKSAAAEYELGGLQVLDRGGLAAFYHVDPAKPFMVLDQSRKVIAAAPTAQGLDPILDQLTKYRKPRR